MPTKVEEVTEVTVQPQTEAVPLVSAGYRRYALFVLMIVFAVNFLDRQVINILAESIKHDLGLADWQIGLMTGFAFAIFYSTFGIPIARLAERLNRPYIIATAMTIWSGFTALCGLAQNFGQLLALRVGVGIGEAGCTPPAHSLITDYTPREKRSSAMAFYHMGVPLGMLLGMAMGGVIADSHGWRTAFVVAGIPGLVMAAVAAITLKEPRRTLAASEINHPTLAETLRFLRTKRSFWCMSLGAAAKAFVGYGQAPFTAVFFFRVHGPELATLGEKFGLQSAGFLGLSLGLIGGLTGMVGTWLGGQLSDLSVKRDVRAFASIPAVAALVGIPITVAAMLAPTALTALAFIFVGGIVGSLWSGPVHAAVLSIPPPAMRATTSSLLLFILNMIGLGLGPLFIGLLSDLLAGPGGLGSAEGVRWSLIISSGVGLFTFALFWTARRSLAADMQ